LSRLALNEPVTDADFDWGTRTAIRLVRNVDEATELRLVGLFQAALSSTDAQLAPRFKALLSNRALRRAEYETALEMARDGRNLALVNGLEAEASLCSAFAGSACQWMGRFSEAGAWFEEALVAARRCADSSLEANALSSRALLHMLLGQPDSALTTIDAAIAIYQQSSDHRQIARCRLNRGIFRSKVGQLISAHEDLNACLEEFVQSGLATYANSGRLALARVLRLLGNPRESQSLVEDVRRNASEGNDPRSEIIALEYLGDLSLDTGNLASAREHYEESFKLAERVGTSTDLYLETSYRYGLALGLSGDAPQLAIALCERAAALARELNDGYELAAALFAQARCILASDEEGKAETILKESSQVASRIGDRFTRAAVSLALSKVAFARGDSLEAVGLATEAKREFEALPAPRWIAEADTWLTELATGIATRTLVENVSHPKSAAARSEIGIVPLGGIPSFITADQHVRQLLTTTLKLAPRSLSMLVLGETGTGKELVAEAIHNASDRKGPFVPVNCGALPGDLLEAELFGHARGAYTGADRERGGLIEFSHRGTLFLDEIGDMPLKAQARLLRALERGEVRRLGENAPRLVDLRIVAATHRNLLEMVSAGDFRLDLYHRLTGFVITIPPLRERAGDVELLIDHFLAGFAREQDKVVQIAPEVRSQLAHHAWPGNVRQLRNVVHRLVSLSEAGQTLSRMPFELEGAESPRSLPEALDAEERRRILAALQASNWNKAKAAAALGASRTTLIGKMKRLGIEPPDSGARVR
jgi:transcriptional regulator with PAS, ATPase and Fis domain